MFRLKDKNFITNEKGKVIAVDKGKDIEQANIIMEDKNGKIH
jgi:hypothetical protein